VSATPKTRTTNPGVAGSVLEAARTLAGIIKADHILVVAHSDIDEQWLSETVPGQAVVLAVESKRRATVYEREGYKTLEHRSPPLDRFSRIAHAILSAISAGLIEYRALVVSVTGPIGGDAFDSITVTRTTALFRELTVLEQETGRKSHLLPVIKATLDIALELGAFGIEGRPVGTMFVIGDTASVLKLSRQGMFNPFKGYEDKYKNILDPALRGTVREFSQIDGAFIVRDDGVISAGGRLLLMPKGTAPILKGMGARHNSAAFITKETDSIAVVVSQTTGSVTLISKGRILFTLNPASRTASALYPHE